MSRRAIWRWLKRLYAIATLGLLTWATVAAWPAIQQWQLHQLAPAAAAAMAGWIGMAFLLGCGWAGALHAWSGLQLSLRQWLPMQAAAWVGRYLPGKIGLLAGKMQVCEQGAGWRRITGSVVSEQLAFIASGCALSGLALPYWLPLLSPAMQQHPTALLALLWLPSLAMLALGAWLAGKQLPEAHKSWMARLLSWSTLAHIAAGVGFHFLLVRLLPDAPSLIASIGLLAAAHTAGVLAVFAPAGLGVREAVIAAALAPQLGWPQAIAITALQRALAVLADACIALTAALFRRKS